MNRMPSVMTHAFSHVPQAHIPRSTFDRSHGFKATFDAGYLVPMLVDEALPGDTFNVSMTGFARLSTPMKPVMDNLFMETFFFAVPIRLVWNNFVKFMGEQDNPADSTDYVVPTMTSTAVTGYPVDTLHDFLGLPIQVPDLVHSSLFHRAYNLIWNQWFRDENLQNSVVVDKDDGPDSPVDYVLLRRGKRHDYFTSCLPWPQKGTSVALPLGTIAPVVSDGAIVRISGNGGAMAQLQTAAAAASPITHVEATGAGTVTFGAPGATTTGLRTDLSTATAATINQIREAFQLQRLYERDARGGSRYTEIVRSHFGVTSPDQRLQRAEYLGGGSTPVNVTPVPVTNTNTANLVYPGQLGGFGVAAFNGHGFTKSFTEHCLILGLVNVRADLTYQQGLPRMFSRSTRFDFYWPTLATLGEQAVLNKEIYAQGSVNPAQDAAVFGYQERYAEYRYKPSQIAGKFRSVYAQSLDVWHLSQEFGALPTLSSSFIVDNPPMNRVQAIGTEPHFFFDSYIRMKCARPMPVYGVPGMIDHF